MKSSGTVITAESAYFYTSISILLLLGRGELSIRLKLRHPIPLRSFNIFISTLASRGPEQVGLINQLRVIPTLDAKKNELLKAYLSMSS
jgi:hypothetical protein